MITVWNEIFEYTISDFIRLINVQKPTPLFSLLTFCGLVLVFLIKLHKLALVVLNYSGTSFHFFFLWDCNWKIHPIKLKHRLWTRFEIFSLDLVISEIGFRWSLWLVNRMAIVSLVRNRCESRQVHWQSFCQPLRTLLP